MRTQIVICCGSGGVGKTTISAALGVAQAHQGHNVCVITIDPAKRLADSLGIEELGNTPRPIPLNADCSGSLHGMMLDAHSTFDDVIRKHAQSPASAQRLLDNRYYQFASSRLGGSHEYMAMHKLLELVESEQFDVIILDTPPTQQALEFLAAPDKMRGLMDQGVLKWLVMPASGGGWRALELGSELLAKALKKLLGKGTVSEIGEFFQDFQEHWANFRTRSEQAQTLLRQEDTRFVLVTAPTPFARDEAMSFLSILQQERLPFAGFVVNRFLEAPEHCPPEWSASGNLSPTVMNELNEAVQHRHQQSQSHAQVVRSIQGSCPRGSTVWVVPDQGFDLHNTDGLSALAANLPHDLWTADD